LHTQSEFKQLQNMATTIVDESCGHAEISQALDAFAALCSSITHIEPSPTFIANSGDTELDQGVAINPEAAAQCVKDYPRSIQFIRGTFSAITRKLANKDVRVELLYAGCGPYATLLLPLLTLLPLDRLNITLLDIHPESLESVQQLVRYFGLIRFNLYYVCDDACQYQHDTPIDIAIAEVMQKALEQEPQVMVTANLASQMKPDGFFVPERVQIELWLADGDHEQQQIRGLEPIAFKDLQLIRNRQFIGSVFELNVSTINTLLFERGVVENGKTSQILFENIQLPKRAPTTSTLMSLSDVILVTRIQTFGDYWLNDYESDLSLPVRLPQLIDTCENRQLAVRYQLGRYPIFEFQIIDEDNPGGDGAFCRERANQ